MNEYKIVIELPEAVQDEEAIAQQKAQRQAEKQQQATNKLLKFVAVDQIRNYGMSYLRNRIATTELETGSREQQQKLEFAMDVVDFGFSTYQTATATSALTTMAGLGGGLGTLIGIAVSVAGVMVNYGLQKRVEGIQRQDEAKTLNVTRERAGILYNRSRRGA